MGKGLIRIRKAVGRLARRFGPTAHLMADRRAQTRRRVLERMPRGSRCAEIGVWRGDFSQMILDVVQPSELHLIDPWIFIPESPDAWEGGRLADGQLAMDAVWQGVVDRFAGRDEVVIHRRTSAEAAGSFAPESLDWVYIDGDHRYEYVKADLADYLPVLRPSGLVAGDDYYKGDDKGFPVKTAVDECVASGAAELVAILDSQYILRKR